MLYPTQEMVRLTKPRPLPLYAKALLVMLVLLITAPKALADGTSAPLPPIEMPTTHLVLKTGDGKLTGPNGVDYRIPQGSHVLNPDAWSMQDAEFKRLQDAETRLTAENKSLRSSADSLPILPIAIGIGLGIIVTSYVAVKLSD